MKSRPEHEVAYQDICALVRKHEALLTPLELLAVAANMLGKLLAMQDQRSVTPAQAMKVVVDNMELGNQQAVAQVSATVGNA